MAPFAHSPRGAWPRVGGPGSGPGGSERRVRVADSIPMAQGHRGRGGARVGGVGADFGSAPPRAAACASGGLGYREGESRGGARSFCDRRGWVRCAAPPIFRASGAREVALILLSYAQTSFSVGLIARSPRESKQPSSLATVASRIQSRLSARRWHYWLVACCGAGLRECREASPVRSSSCGRSAAIRTRRLERFGWGSRRRVGSRLRVSSIGTVRGGTRAGPLAASIAVVWGRGTMRSDVFGSITLIGRSSGPRSCKPKRPIAPKIWGHVPYTWTDWWRDS